jgi:hypothetical protein
LCTIRAGQDNFPDYITPSVIMGVTTLIYAISFIFVLIFSKSDNFILPKTWDTSIESKVKDFFWWSEPTTIAASLLFTITVFIAIYFTCRNYIEFSKTCMVLLTGLGISTLSAWSWWRISETFMKFLMDWKRTREVNDDTTPVKET